MLNFSNKILVASQENTNITVVLSKEGPRLHSRQYEQTKLPPKRLSVSSSEIVFSKSCLRGTTHIPPQRQDH